AGRRGRTRGDRAHGRHWRRQTAGIFESAFRAQSLPRLARRADLPGIRNAVPHPGPRARSRVGARETQGDDPADHERRGGALDQISAAPSALLPLKAELATWPAAACRDLAKRALECSAAEEVRQLIRDCEAQRPVPLLEPEMVVMNSESTTKEEALKELTDRL